MSFNPIFSNNGVFESHNTGYNIPMLNNQKIEEKVTEIPISGDGIDWGLISECNIEYLVEDNKIDDLEQIISSFMKSKLDGQDSRIFNHPLAIKMFKILQVAINYYGDCQKQLMDKNEQLSEKIQKMKSKKHKSKSKIEELKAKLAIPQPEKCIVCGRKFKNMEYLDSHVERRHSGLITAWRSLRCGELCGIDGVVEEIEKLRAALEKTKLEMKEQKIKKQSKSPVSKENEEQLKLIIELKEKQEQMLQQVKDKNDEQYEFKKQIKNQLDDAVAALRDSHKEWVIQTSRTKSITKAPSAKSLEILHTNEAPKIPSINVDLDFLFNPINIPDVIDQKQDENIEPSHITLEQIISREKEQIEIIEEIGTSSEEVKTEEKSSSEVEISIDLINRAKMIITSGKTNIENPQKDSEMQEITQRVLEVLKENATELKKKRPYCQLSVPFVRKCLKEDNSFYISFFDKQQMEVAARFPSEGFNLEKLFTEKDVKFPVLQTRTVLQFPKPIAPTIEQPQPKQLYTASNKLPIAQRQNLNRPIGLPGDIDIESVSHLTSELESASIAYEDDPYLYKRRKTIRKQALKDDSSSEHPLNNQIHVSDSEIKELNIDTIEFTSDSEDGDIPIKPIIPKRKHADPDKSEDIFGDFVSENTSSSNI